MEASSARHPAEDASDANAESYWLSEETGAAQFISIDLGREYELSSFSYTP